MRYDPLLFIHESFSNGARNREDSRMDRLFGEMEKDTIPLVVSIFDTGFFRVIFVSKSAYANLTLDKGNRVQLK